jgi:class 3 adenylate cyclase
MLGNSFIENILARILSTPENVNSDTARFIRIVKIGSPIGLAIHIIYLMIFWKLDLMVLANFNAASVFLWASGIWLVYVHQNIQMPFVVLVLIEIPLHAILATVYLGMEPAFYFYLLSTVTLTLVNSFFERRLRIIISGFYVLMFVALGAVTVVTEPLHQLSENWQLFFFMFNATGIALLVSGYIGTYEWMATKAEAELTVEYDRAEGLLRNILPDAIAEKLKDSPELIAEEHEQVSILFADIVGFTAASSRLTPAALIVNLNRVFSRFDDLVSKYDVEKIKTIGDAYMVVAGLPSAQKDHATIIVSLALDMLEAANEINEVSDIPLEIRIGINSGPVVAGVIGHKKFAYDLWGDAVNVAARMEELGQAGTVQITQATRKLLGDEFSYRDLGQIDVKGKGELQAYSVTDENRSFPQ